LIFEGTTAITLKFLGGTLATKKVATATMVAAQITIPGGEFEVVEREIPKPNAGEVLIKVQPCGVCHSDVFAKEGLWPGIQYPRVPGHEVVGVIDEQGAGVNAWGSATTAGTTTRVSSAGVGASFSAGTLSLPALSYDGGYQQYMVAPVEALVAAIPDTLSAAEAAPLLCAGVTTFNALRHSGASPGSLVAVQGVGGLGHLAIQFGNKFGYKVVAISRGPENSALAKNLAPTCTSTAKP